MFLKFGHIARPLESLREVNVWEGEETEYTEVEGTTTRKKVKKTKLRLEFADGSAWSFELKPEPKDREIFLKKFLRALNGRVIVDVPKLVERMIEKG